MAELTELTLAQVQAGLRQGAFSAVELIEAYLAAIERARVLNAYIADTLETARAMAAESDQRLRQGAARPLEGIPLGIKDLFATRGVHTQAGSRILDGLPADL